MAKRENPVCCKCVYFSGAYGDRLETAARCTLHFEETTNPVHWMMGNRFVYLSCVDARKGPCGMMGSDFRPVEGWWQKFKRGPWIRGWL